MSEDVRVNPNPIQRNKFDVAIELLQIYNKEIGINADDIETLFAKYYSLANYCERMSVRDLQKLVSEEILNKVGRLG